jgi:BASS family bile acid:Na+ symporter
MDIIPDYLRVLTYLFLIAYMLSVGLETTHGEIQSTLRDSKLTAFALLANWVLVPIVAVILTSIIKIDPDIRIGILLLAIAPGGLFALNFARVSHSNVHLAVGLLLLLSLSAILVTPLLAHFIFGSGTGISWIFRLMVMLLLLILVPLFVGRWIATLVSQPVSQKMAKIIGIGSILLFITVQILAGKIRKPAMGAIGMNGIAIIILLVIICWIIGWFLGGREFHNKTVMALSTSLRNVGVCMPLAIQEFPARNEIVAILAFSGISIPMNFLFATAMKIIAKHKHLVSSKA